MTGGGREYVFLGLSITSAWGNGHATTYRGLLKELAARGHSITFLERDAPWYAANREFETLPYCRVILYRTLEELKDRHSAILRAADAVVIGSYVPEGIALGRWVRAIRSKLVAFYDIDTPVTLSAVAANKCEYLSSELIRDYDLYLSFTGGPTLNAIEQRFGSPCARALYCSVDPTLYFPRKLEAAWDLAYLGTYAADRQPTLHRLLRETARQSQDRRFAVAGPQYPAGIEWPRNVTRIEHLPAAEHGSFYNSQSFALNITRQEMIQAGYSPSVRLFEASACGVPILTDEWPGLEAFFQPHSEIVPVRTSADVLKSLSMPIEQRLELAANARRRTLRFHTAAVRAAEFDTYVDASQNRLCRSNKKKVVASSKSADALLEK